LLLGLGRDSWVLGHSFYIPNSILEICSSIKNVYSNAGVGPEKILGM
jgi:hypothetical protein